MAQAAPPTSLTRLCVLEDGRVKAQFADNSVLLLAASGAAFVHAGGDGSASGGTLIRQLSDYALSRFIPKLAVALRFRNMHCDTPFHCAALRRCSNADEQQPEEGFALGFRVDEAFWPPNAHAAWATPGALALQQDGSLALTAQDGLARMSLHPTRQRFAVCYPLLIHEGDLHRAGGQHLYTYSWQSQVFSVGACPRRWSAALTLLLQAAARGPDTAEQKPSVPSAACSTPISANALALHPAPGAAAAFDQPPVVTRLPTAHIPPPASANRTDDFTLGSWWLEPSITLLPPDALVVMEWTPEAAYEFHPAAQEVHAWVQADDSCIASTRGGRFVAHIRRGGLGDAASSHQQHHQQLLEPVEKLYAVSSIPEHVHSWPAPGGGPAGRVPLGTIAAHALKLRQHMCGVMDTKARRQAAAAATAAAVAPDSGACYVVEHAALPHAGAIPHNSFHAQSEEVVDSVHLPGYGSFTAYADGRVRALYTDRTIIHLNACHTHCKAILPDGQRVTVAADNPVGLEGHVRALLDFCTWAFKPPEARRDVLRAHAIAVTQASATHRMAQLLDHSLAGGKRAGAAQQRALQPQLPLLALAPASAGAPLTTPWRQSMLPAGSAASGGSVHDMQARVEELLRANQALLLKL